MLCSWSSPANLLVVVVVTTLGAYDLLRRKCVCVCWCQGEKTTFCVSTCDVQCILCACVYKHLLLTVEMSGRGGTGGDPENSSTGPANL